MHHQQLWEMPPARRYFEYLVRFFVFYSIGMYLLEMEVTKAHHSDGFWLLNERFVAVFFTVEYLIRWAISDNKRHFPFKLLSIIDLIAIVPFYVGFFVDDHTLDIIRTLRVLRMFKLVRYSPALMNVVEGIKKVKSELYVVGYIVCIVVVFSSVLILQFEKDAQPDKFDKPSDALWWSFVTMATVGYGDLAPVTLAGRVVAIFTMVIGIGVFGVFVSLIGSALIVTWKEQQDEQRKSNASLQSKPPDEGLGRRSEIQEAAEVGNRGNLSQEQVGLFLEPVQQPNTLSAKSK